MADGGPADEASDRPSGGGNGGIQRAASVIDEALLLPGMYTDGTGRTHGYIAFGSGGNFKKAGERRFCGAGESEAG